MEDKYIKYQFSSISIKKEVSQRFRAFSKGVSSSHTKTLRAMLDFFEIHQLFPMDTIDGSLRSVEIRIERRINNALAIIKSIEQSQTLPTTAMLQSSFEQQLEQEDDTDYLDEYLEFIEKKFENVERGGRLKKPLSPK